MNSIRTCAWRAAIFVFASAGCVAGRADGKLYLGPEQFVQADGGNIDVPGYSVPSFAHWNNDGLEDLIVGEGEGGMEGKVRVYLNTGSPGDPAFTDYTYVQSNGVDFTVEGFGCMGTYPRVVYWDADDRKDLLVGLSDGTVMILTNVGTEEDPTFDEGTLLQVGEPGNKIDIDVQKRACAEVVDWNNDGRKDLAVGSANGKIYLYINEGTDTEPDFITEQFVQEDGEDLIVPEIRASPDFLDVDFDGRKDIITGNTEGQILYYCNVGTDADPQFSGCVPVLSEGSPIDYPDVPRTRPFVTDWNEDGRLDMLCGLMDGKVHLFLGVQIPGDIDDDGSVDVDDLFAVLGAWGECDDPDDCPEDVNGDGVVNLNDLFAVLNNWG
jgi:hypothetical protein